MGFLDFSNGVTSILSGRECCTLAYAKATSPHQLKSSHLPNCVHNPGYLNKSSSPGFNFPTYIFLTNGDWL